MSDLLDLLDAEEAKAMLGIRGDAPARLGSRITAISRRLDQACGAIVRRTVTGETHDGYGGVIRLNNPAYAFTSVTEYQGTSSVTLTLETVGTQPTDGYFAERHGPDPTIYSGVLRRRSGGAGIGFYSGLGNVSVTYTAGRYATTATVAPHFKEAALIMLRNLSGTDEPGVVTVGEFDTPGGRFPTFAIPNAVRELLWAEWREVPGVG